MGTGVRRGGRKRWTRTSRGPALARIAALLLVVIGAYAAGAAQAETTRWVAGALILPGIVLLALLQLERLHRNEQDDKMLQAILDSVPHLLFYKDVNSRYLGINRVFEQTFGKRAEDVVGKCDAELFGQALHDRFVAQDRELLESGEARTFNEEIPIDGETRYIESRKTPFYDARGKAIGIIGLAIDVTETRRLRQQLEVGNARLSVALRAAQMGTWTWNADTDELDLDAFEGRLFGLAEGRHRIADLLAGQNIHPDDLEPLRNAVRRALREGVAVGYEFRAPDKAVGGWRWVEGSAIRYAEPGKPTWLIGVNRDITQRKRQELELTQAKHDAERALAALAQSRADLELALRSGRLGVWHSEVRGADRADQPGQFGLEQPVDWDVNTRRIFGHGPNEPLTRRHYFEVLHPEDRERVLAGFARSRDGEYADQYRIVRPDGQVRMIAVYGAAPTTRVDPDTAETVYSMTGIVRDITDEENLKANLRQKVREAQQATSDLEQARTDLELALRSGRLGVWHSEYRDVSEADRPDDPGLDDPIDWDVNVRRIFGRSADERVTRGDFFEALHPDDRERVIDHLSGAAERGGYYTDKYRVRLPDGRMRWVEVHATIEPRNGSDADADANRRITGIARDITDEEDLKADLRQKAYEAQQATEAKARFLAMMSHEIRTPMNGVVGMIELLAETPMTPEQQQMLKICKDSTFVLLTIINDILDFSKIEAGKLELERARLSPRRLVDTVGEALGTLASQRGIDLDVHVAPEVPRRVIGDRVRLRQILINLTSNAIKFTERGGVTVTASVERGESRDDRTHVRFDIVDTGIGMDEETVSNLFQPFQQADAATTRRFGGTGLGLSIARNLTELMGGRIECESRPMEGSRFSVVIPFETAAAGERDWGYPIAGIQVLALAAQSRRQQIIAEFIDQFGASVRFADSPDDLLEQAQEAVARREVDLVLLDKDGSISERIGLRRRFSEDRRLSHIPFVVVRSNEPVSTKLIPDAVAINGNPLTRTSLIQGIAVALGWVSPLVPAVGADRLGEPAQAPSREREAEAGRLVLLAEDNPTNREVISRQLARLGYACDVAEDGEGAWTMLQSGAVRYALLLTDCHMPRLDGYQLARRIRTHERGSGVPALPIVAITANALQGEGERCLALGMNGYLAKPLQLRELKRLLEEFLPRSAMESTSASASPDTEPQPVTDAAGFPVLEDILGGDESKVRHVLGVFERSTRSDCEQLEAAHLGGDLQRMRELAHKLKSGCRQLGEEATALALDAVERSAAGNAPNDKAFDDEFAAARDGLHRLLARVDAHLGTEPDR